MYDYMKALQRQFETKPRSIQNLSDEVDRTHKELSSRLVKDDRKLLLRLVDMEDSLDPVYSFAREEEERACSKAQVHDKDDTDA